MDSVKSSEELVFITCSCSSDFGRCARLCASMDKFFSTDVRKFIIVPGRDRQRFSTLASADRTIISTEDVLPSRFIYLPLLNKWWFDNAMWPIRGWIMQHVAKLCADTVTDVENIVFVNSDIEFSQPLKKSRLLLERTLRQQRRPSHKSDGIHLKWHHSVAVVLGFEPQHFGWRRMCRWQTPR